MYTQYCANESTSQNKLAQLKKDIPELEALLENIKNSEPVERLDLESYLIKPLQRVTKYPLLLKVTILIAVIRILYFDIIIMTEY